jgi:hypothetical protein
MKTERVEVVDNVAVELSKMSVTVAKEEKEELEKKANSLFQKVMTKEEGEESDGFEDLYENLSQTSLLLDFEYLPQEVVEDLMPRLEIRDIIDRIHSDRFVNLLIENIRELSEVQKKAFIPRLNLACIIRCLNNLLEQDYDQVYCLLSNKKKRELENLLLGEWEVLGEEISLFYQNLESCKKTLDRKMFLDFMKDITNLKSKFSLFYLVLKEISSLKETMRNFCMKFNDLLREAKNLRKEIPLLEMDNQEVDCEEVNIEALKEKWRYLTLFESLNSLGIDMSQLDQEELDIDIILEKGLSSLKDFQEKGIEDFNSLKSFMENNEAKDEFWDDSQDYCGF